MDGPAPRAGPQAVDMADQQEGSMIVLDRTQAVHRAVGLAGRAPSVHNTQPWRIAIRGGEITLGMDADRRLAVSDPDGRELRISCGAALFTLRLALRYLGFPPTVRLLPEPDNPGVLARLQIPANYLMPEPQPWMARMFTEIERRTTHRGPFSSGPLDDTLITMLERAAATEHAQLTPVRDTGQRVMLAAVTQAAEYAQRGDPARREELARWSRAPGSPRDDGVHPTDYPHDPDTGQAGFPGRDYSAGRAWGTQVRIGGETGQPFVLATPDDDSAAWLAAGQALQRILLEASAQDLSVALHTQALEEPGLRAFLTHRLGTGHPQMIMRIGAAAHHPPARRLPYEETTFEIPD